MGQDHEITLKLEDLGIRQMYIYDRFVGQDINLPFRSGLILEDVTSVGKQMM